MHKTNAQNVDASFNCPSVNPWTKKLFENVEKLYRTFCVSTCRQVTFQNFIWQGPSLFEPLLPHGTWGATDVDVDMDDTSVQKMDGAGPRMQILH